MKELSSLATVTKAGAEKAVFFFGRTHNTRVSLNSTLLKLLMPW